MISEETVIKKEGGGEKKNNKRSFRRETGKVGKQFVFDFKPIAKGEGNFFFSFLLNNRNKVV